ncbi:SpoIIE family protein phosphatase [Streptomyces himalayensis]|uniref:SpoIIE family protein phosphatase n=1 Tax=Streptomyces himalayensis subsp. himalayensis TaxID=2756131 RepID=A0A7W0DMQ1_9ACTN|nr:SpoIIE family protein phosphatase [Streptomyces himalayensis]MBA2947565.1 SpoIIE family protein phosphatase [Streptomyces himalayensis subsp. himalayensis]
MGDGKRSPVGLGEAPVLAGDNGDSGDNGHSGDYREQLAEELERALEGLGAHAGGVFLLHPAEHLLKLTVLVGIPREIAAPWELVNPATAMPTADPVRTGDLVWVNGHEAWMRQYPRIAVATPYDYTLAAVPVIGTHGPLGSVFALWPGTLPSRIPPKLETGMWQLAADLARTLESRERTRAVQSVDPAGAVERLSGDRPVHHERGPLVHPAGPSPPPGTAEAAEHMVARLPEGVCALDIDGRVTSVTPSAARLLGAPAEHLIGARPWEVAPWLRDALYDPYRAAVVSGRPTSEACLRPPDQWLNFAVYPGASGLTVRISEAPGNGADAVPGAEPIPAARDNEPPLTHAGVLYHVLHLASALTEAVGVEDVVNTVADDILPAYGSRALAILTAESGRVRLIGHRGYSPEVVARYDDSLWRSSEPGARSVALGHPMFFESMAELDQAFPARAGVHDGMGAWAFLPLIASGRTIGTCILAYAGPHRFTTGERAVLTSLGGLIAQALDRARLYDKKLEIAHALQERLLPHTLPIVSGLEAATRYLPGTEGMDIGGDFYDLVRVRRDAAIAVIGDVQGHNVTAAALMGQIRTAVHAYATADARPSGILAGTNRLLADLDAGLFASCACLSLDLGKHVACAASAGHPRILVRTPDGAVRTLDAPTGLLLGIEAEVHYSQTVFPMPDGTTFALYTDGLVESPGTDIDEGVAGLAIRLEQAGALSLEALADILVSHARTARQRADDIALLLLRSGRPP